MLESYLSREFLDDVLRKGGWIGPVKTNLLLLFGEGDIWKYATPKMVVQRQNLKWQCIMFGKNHKKMIQKHWVSSSLAWRN